MLDSLPYFLQLIKNNLVLSTIVTTGSFSNIELKEYKYYSYTDSSIIFENFQLGQGEVFSQVMFGYLSMFKETGDTVSFLSFTTSDPKFFENTAFYFGEDVDAPINSHPDIVMQRQKKKKIGFKKLFDAPVPPAFITIMKNPAYGYGIELKFFSNHIEVKKFNIRQVHYLNFLFLLRFSINFLTIVISC